MITDSEYKEIEPHREDIMKFHRTGNCKGTVLPIADRIRQRYSMSPPINYGCDACKAAAMNDIYNLMIEYEQNFTRNI